jgi:L-serine dehydratase
MESLKELYKVGPGPSSSHTVAPWRAAILFKEKFPDAVSFDAELYGSLSLTGRGHFTDKIIMDTFKPKLCKVSFKLHWEYDFDNGIRYRAYNLKNEVIGEWNVFSLGGGSIKVVEEEFDFQRNVYPYRNLKEIYAACEAKGIAIPALVKEHEPDIEIYLNKILADMFRAVERGLKTTGMLPGRLNMPRIAKSLKLSAESMDDHAEKQRMRLIAYAYANNEENASCGMVVTAPTLGASGIVAAIMYHFYHDIGVSKNKLVQALMVGGMFGNVIKRNATISGALGGCQAEIGAACAMAAAAVAYLNDFNLKQIEYAAEIAMEHHLGLTCDPVGGYVIIPCIERNGAAVLRAMDAAMMARFIGNIKPNRVSFDMVVHTMNYTGKRIPMELRETSLGGLATEIIVASDEGN